MSHDLAYAIWDAFPATELHALMVTRRQEELAASHDLLRDARESLVEDDPSIVGFNIGTNVGKRLDRQSFAVAFS